MWLFSLGVTNFSHRPSVSSLVQYILPLLKYEINIYRKVQDAFLIRTPSMYCLVPFVSFFFFFWTFLVGQNIFFFLNINPTFWQGGYIFAKKCHIIFHFLITKLKNICHKFSIENFCWNLKNWRKFIIINYYARILT